MTTTSTAAAAVSGVHEVLVALSEVMKTTMLGHAAAVTLGTTLMMCNTYDNRNQPFDSVYTGMIGMTGFAVGRLSPLLSFGIAACAIGSTWYRSRRFSTPK